LALGIEELHRQGMRDLLLICEDDNFASIRIVEAAGAQLEAIVSHPHFPERLVRRYWVREKLA
jgi:predicted acetyltransferase